MTRKIYIPEAFGKSPENSTEALLAAAALLEEEGRWRQCTWFTHDDPNMQEYKDDPFCNGWQACADGALQIVTVGLSKEDEDALWDVDGNAYVYAQERLSPWVSEHQRIYSEARDRMTAVIRIRYPISGSVETFNDCHDRDEVIALLREVAGMEDAQ